VTKTVHRDELEARVRAALAERARRLPRTDRPFRVDAPVLFEEPLVERHRLRWVAAAVVMVMIGALATAVVVRSDGRSSVSTATNSDSSASPTSSVGAPVPGALASGPSEAGLQLWSIAWGSSPPVDSGSRSELFGRPNGTPGKVLVQVSGANPGSTGCCSPVAVRGQSGQIAPAKEFSDSASTIVWQEEATMRATFNGMSEQQALDFLGTLTWRGQDHQAGLAPPSESDLVLLGESDGTPSGPVVAADLVYRDQPAWTGPGSGRQIEVRTTDAVGRVTADYLKVWFDGDRVDDRTVQSFDPSFGTLHTVTTTGQSVWVDGYGTVTDRTRLQGIADHVMPRTGSEMLGLRNDSERLAAQLPVLGSVTLSSGTVEIHGTSDAQSVCLLIESQPARCSAPEPAGLTALGSFLVDGRWYVLAAGGSQIQVTTDPPAPTYNSGQPASRTVLAAEHGTVAGQLVLLCQPPDDLDTVLVGDNQQIGVVRPPF
jgi:hypothetical protein